MSKQNNYYQRPEIKIFEVVCEQNFLSGVQTTDEVDPVYENYYGIF